MTDTVTAKLAEWGALVEANLEEDLRADLSPIATALLGFAREVRGLHASSQDTRGVGQIRDGAWTAYCEEDFEDWPCPTEQVAQKWIGGER